MHNIKNFLSKITNVSFNIDELQLIYDKPDEQVFSMNTDLSSFIDSSPTVIVKKTQIYFNMNINRRSLLNNIFIEKINEFNDIFNKYLNIYNSVQTDNNIKNVDIYLKFCYNIEDKSYTLSLTHDSYLFTTFEDMRNPSYAFQRAIFNAMRCDPNEPMIGEMMLSAPLILNENKNLYPNVILLRYKNDNLIYSSKKDDLKNMFTLVNGFYQEHELFTAIQTYLNLTENDSCNILDPQLIKKTEHLDNLINLCKMIDIK